MAKTQITDRRLLAHKATLLLSPENPILQNAKKTLEDQHVRITKRALLIEAFPGLSHDTLGRWQRMEVGEVDSDTVAKLIIAIARCDIECCETDFSDEGKKYEFGAKLGFDHTQVQKIIDMAFIMKKAHMSGFFMKPELAGPLERRTRGIYHLYFLRPKSTSSELVRASLRVRYALYAGRRGVSIIRCKLHIPYDDQKYFQYDGVLTRRGEHAYWYFDEVSNDTEYGNDMVTIISSMDWISRSSRGRGVITSVTTDQRTYSSYVHFKKVDVRDSSDREEAKYHMRESIGVCKSTDARFDLSPLELEDLQASFFVS